MDYLSCCILFVPDFGFRWGLNSTKPLQSREEERRGAVLESGRAYRRSNSSNSGSPYQLVLAAISAKLSSYELLRQRGADILASSLLCVPCESVTISPDQGTQAAPTTPPRTIGSEKFSPLFNQIRLALKIDYPALIPHIFLLANTPFPPLLHMCCHPKSRGKETTPAKRATVWTRHCSGYSMPEIIRLEQLPRSTIRSIISRREESGDSSFKSKPRSGRPKKNL
jgi:hypothetical protein